MNKNIGPVTTVIAVIGLGALILVLLDKSGIVDFKKKKEKQ
jgi:hypothetical protein